MNHTLENTTLQAFNQYLPCFSHSLLLSQLPFRQYGFFLINFYLFIYFWLCLVFTAVRGLSLVATSRGYSSWRCVGFSLRWLLSLRSTGSRRSGFHSLARGLSSCGSQALECRLSSCGTRAYLLCGMWDLLGPGLQPVSPALAGRFLTTVPPGKSRQYVSVTEIFSFIHLLQSGES